MKQDLISTTELARRLNTSNDVILSIARKNNIKKDIINGKPTFWNEEEASIIIKNIDYNNSQSKQALTEVKGNIKTELNKNY